MVLRRSRAANGGCKVGTGSDDSCRIKAARDLHSQHVIECHRRKPRVEWRPRSRPARHDRPSRCIHVIREEKGQPVSNCKSVDMKRSRILATRSEALEKSSLSQESRDGLLQRLEPLA